MKKYLLLLCAVIGLFTACKKNNLPPVDTLKAISLGKDTLVMKVGQTVQLTITTIPADYDKALLRLSSSDTTIITVKNNGQVTAKKTGKAVITVTNLLKTVSVTCQVTVALATDPLTGVLFTDTLSMNSGDVVQLHYTTTPPNYDPALLVWKSSDTTVVSVTNTGKVSAKEEGVSTITLTNKAKTFTVSGIVQVTDRLKRGLLAYYPFNNNANDLSGHGNNGIAYDLSSVPDRFGKPNAAVYFNGTSSYIRIKDNQPLRLKNNDFTINYWVYLDEYNSSTGSAVLAKNTGPYQNGWNASITGYAAVNAEAGKLGRAFYNVSGGGDPFAVGNMIIDTGKWTMVTILYSNQQHVITFYINGVLDAATPNIPTPNPTTATDLFIGKNTYIDPSGITPAYLIKGRLDDIRIYNRMINKEGINKLFARTY
jgi:hypothetical protein